MVTVRESSRKNADHPARAWKRSRAAAFPSGSSLDAGELGGKVVSLPTREQINLPVQEQLIVELYSK